MATVNIELSSHFAELCRICGSKTSVLLGLHIFEREGILREIYKKIKGCLPIQVAREDKLPKMVCEECVYKLDALFEFRERSVKTEYELHEMLKISYSPSCNETITIPIESFCNGTEQEEGLHVQPPEVEINLENNSEPLEAIITLPMRPHDSLIKCEPELIIKNDESQQRVSLKKSEGKQSEGDSQDSSRSVEVEQSEQCANTEGIGDTLQVHSVRPLQAVNNRSSKDIEISSSQSYIISAPPASNSVHTPSQSQPWLYCNICGKAFHCNEDFQSHCENHWGKCTECDVMCANEESLVAHMREAHQFTNRSEEISTNDPKTKAAEKRDTSRIDGRQCPECGKEYKSKYKLTEHMRKHTGERPFKCSMCEKSFRSKIGLAQHEAKHTGQYDYNCMTCGKGFQCKSYLVVHQRVHSDLKPYTCDTCGRNFKTKQSLLDHQNRHLGVKPYLCEVCGRGFITKGLCKSHQKVHSGMDNRQYPCSVCNKLFVSKSYLTTHLRIHTGEKPFMCEVCGKGFLTRVDLRIHSTMHTGEKSFVCEVCGKAFARRDALRCHKRSHTGERPYKCDICGQGFTQFSPMAIHKRLHTGERPYSCDICLKAFVSRSTMMSHRKKHNPS